MRAIEQAFGAPIRAVGDPAWSPYIVIRHGFKSSSAPLESLRRFLETQFPAAYIDNQSYDWKESVFRNGTELAYKLICCGAGRPIAMIGHSMGGLVCRTAAAILNDSNFRVGAAHTAWQLGYAGTDKQYFDNRHFSDGVLCQVIGLVTLATPNSGAVLQGQVSGWAAIGQAVAGWFTSTQVASVADLTTDRLFRLLQHAAVSAPILSVSGSRWSRFAIASGQLASWGGLVGINLEIPHDSIVEDRSVDLSASILPNELLHGGAAKYLHIRAYRDCTDVSHTNIYDDPNVRQCVLEFLRRIG